MCRLVETLKIEEGRICNLSLHEERLNRSRYERFHCFDRISLESLLILSDEQRSGLWRCRILYDINVHKVEFSRYESKSVHTLQVVYADEVEYQYKYENRSSIDSLFLLRNGKDDILIVKKGYLTDCSTSNVVLECQDGLFTPRDPLLRGTMRASLLQSGRVQERDIRPEELSHFHAMYLINAFRQLGTMKIRIEDIFL